MFEGDGSGTAAVEASPKMPKRSASAEEVGLTATLAGEEEEEEAAPNAAVDEESASRSSTKSPPPLSVVDKPVEWRKWD